MKGHVALPSLSVPQNKIPAVVLLTSQEACVRSRIAKEVVVAFVRSVFPPSVEDDTRKSAGMDRVTAPTDADAAIWFAVPVRDVTAPAAVR